MTRTPTAIAHEVGGQLLRLLELSGWTPTISACDAGVRVKLERGLVTLTAEGDSVAAVLPELAASAMHRRHGETRARADVYECLGCGQTMIGEPPLEKRCPCGAGHWARR